MAHCHLNLASPSPPPPAVCQLGSDLFKAAHVAVFSFVWPGLFGCGFAPALHIWKVSSEHWEMLLHYESEPELAQAAQGASGVTILGIIKSLLAMVLSNWL